MKHLLLSLTAFLACASAHASVNYELTITNGSGMPVSPAVVYVKSGQAAAAQIGDAATAGFVQLCQTGNGSTRLMELQGNRDVSFTAQTMGPILPGESRTIEVSVQNLMTESIHFEAMYGKTKDVCAVGSVNNHSLVALKQHVLSELIAKDDALSTGAFDNPVMPMTNGVYDPNTCASSNNAVSCLRELAQPIHDGKIHFFTSYSPSVLNFLETKYGAADTNSLVIPSSGAVQFKLKLKH